MLDYALPRASWLPSFELDETVTPSPVNPLGIKGVGEAGAIASTPAVVNAVVDALSPLGIRHVDMPLTDQQVWRAMQAAEVPRRHDPGGIRLHSVRRHLAEALRILAQGDEGTKVINGGQSLLPLLKLRLASVERLVDIGRLPELQGIRAGADGGVGHRRRRDLSGGARVDRSWRSGRRC